MDKLNTERLILLRGVLRDGAVGAPVNAIEQNSVEEYARAYGSLLSADMENSFAGYLSDLILRSDNLFARRACTAQPNLELCAALKSDLRILQRLAKSAETPPLPCARRRKTVFPPFATDRTTDCSAPIGARTKRYGGSPIFIKRTGTEFISETRLSPSKTGPYAPCGTRPTLH